MSNWISITDPWSSIQWNPLLLWETLHIWPLYLGTISSVLSFKKNYSTFNLSCRLTEISVKSTSLGATSFWVSIKFSSIFKINNKIIFGQKKDFIKLLCENTLMSAINIHTHSVSWEKYSSWSLKWLMGVAYKLCAFWGLLLT